MQLLGVAERTVTLLLAMVVMAAIVAVPPVAARESIQRHGGNVVANAHYEKDQNRTYCRIVDYRGNTPKKKYRFYRPGHLEPRACYTYWNQHGHPGAYGKTKSHGWG